METSLRFSLGLAAAVSLVSAAAHAAPDAHAVLAADSVAVASPAPTAESTGGVPGEPAADSVESVEPAPLELDHSRGFEHALRLGISVPFGEETSGRDLNDDVNWRVPVWLDVGYRFSDAIYAAIYTQFGLMGSAQPNCNKRSGQLSTACSAEDVRLGVEVLFNPLPRDALDLWFGAGAAWERLRQTARFLVDIPTGNGGVTANPATIVEITQGMVLDLQAGIDFPLHGAFEAGPFIGYSPGVFLGRYYNCTLVTCPADGISDKAFHHWVTLGVRGTLGP